MRIRFKYFLSVHHMRFYLILYLQQLGKIICLTVIFIDLRIYVMFIYVVLVLTPNYEILEGEVYEYIILRNNSSFIKM